MIHAVLSNPSCPEYGQATVPFPIPTEEYDHVLEVLVPLGIGDPLQRDCQVDELNGEYPVLRCLEGKTINLDELDFLSKRLDSFANLKRGGILLIQIAVGSLYMFSIPRGYIDGFVQWMKQVIGLCLTAFLQSTILVAGLMVFKDHALLGLGLMLSAGEVPRIAGTFGLDTTTRANIMSAVYTAQAAVNTTRTVVNAVASK